MPSTTFTDKVTVVPTAWLNEVNGTVHTLFGAATTAAAGRTALGATATGTSLFTAANAAAGRTALSLGTASTVDTGTSGATIPLLNGTNTWANSQTFSSNVTLGGQLQGKYTTTTAAATVTLGSIPATYIEITGSTNITSFGTVGSEGLEKLLYFPTASVTGTSTPVGTLVYPSDVLRVVKIGPEGNDTWRAIAIYRNGGRTIRAGSGITLDPYTINTTTTVGHGMLIPPTFVAGYFECKTAEGNWSVGDRIDWTSWSTIATSGVGIIVTYDATNVTLITHSTNAPQLLNKTTRAGFTITPANWRLTLIPYALVL